MTFNKKIYNKEYQKKYYKSHYFKGSKLYKQLGEAHKKYHLSLRKKAIDVLGGPICANCGCAVYRILEINHRDGGGNKEKRIFKHRADFYRSIIKGKVNIVNYNILCRVCNISHYINLILGIKGHTIIWKG